MTTTPTPVPDAALPLPDPSDLGTWGARMAEMHRWMREDLRPGMYTLADAAFDNAEYAETMANAAGVQAGFAGSWSGLSGALNVPASVYYPHVDADYWVLVISVTNVEAHTPGVSAAFAPFVPSADSIVFDNTGTDLVAETVQAAIVETLDNTARAWTTAARSASPGIGDTGLNTTLGCIEAWDGVTWVPSGSWSTPTVLTAIGSAIDLTGIPATVREIKIGVANVAHPASVGIAVRLGNSAASFPTTGYASPSAAITAAGAVGMSADYTKFDVRIAGAGAGLANGEITLTRFADAGSWTVSGIVWSTSDPRAAFVGGRCHLGSGFAFDRLRVLTVPSGSLTGGEFFVQWKV